MYSHPAAERARIAVESAEAMKRYQEAKKDPKTPPALIQRLWDEVCDLAAKEMEEKHD